MLTVPKQYNCRVIRTSTLQDCSREVSASPETSHRSRSCSGGRKSGKEEKEKQKEENGGGKWRMRENKWREACSVGSETIVSLFGRAWHERIGAVSQLACTWARMEEGSHTSDRKERVVKTSLKTLRYSLRFSLYLQQARKRQQPHYTSPERGH